MPNALAEDRLVESPAVRRSSWLPDVPVAVTLYVAVAALYLLVVGSVNGSQFLTGEEVSVSFTDVVALRERFQYTHWSTNFAGHGIFWVFSHLDPSFDLFYGRRCKAVLLALVAPLVYLTLRRRLGCGQVGALTGGAVVALLPGVVAFSWLATENGFEAVLGLFGLLVATSRRRLWWTAGIVAGLTVSTYGAGLAWATAILAVLVVRVVRSEAPARWRTAGLALAGVAAGAAVVLFPLLWWTQGGTVVFGGGTPGLAGTGSSLEQLAAELTRGGNSYYYFSREPALGSLAIAVVAGVALVAAVLLRRAIWPWVVVAAATLGMYAVSGGVLGVRRTIALAVVAALALGVGTDLVLRAGARLPRGVVPAGVAVALGVLLVSLTAGLLSWRADWRDGAIRLPADFVFPVPPGRTMAQAVDDLEAGLRSGRLDAPGLATRFEAERTLSMISLRASRQGADRTGIPSGDDIMRFYYEGPRCEARCSPIGGRP